MVFSIEKKNTTTSILLTLIEVYNIEASILCAAALTFCEFLSLESEELFVSARAFSSQ